MRKSILIAGQNKLLEKPLTEIFLNKGYSVIITSAAEDEVNKKELHTILWNMRSPLSAKNVVLNAASIVEKIDEALVLFSPAKIIKPFHETSAAEIERSVDFQLKSNLFIMKEIIAYFQKQGRGTLSLVHHLPGTEILPPMDALGAGSFTGLVKSLFTFYQNEQVSINAYLSSSSETEEYSDFIFRTISERQKPVHGKFYKFSEKNVLSALGISKKR